MAGGWRIGEYSPRTYPSVWEVPLVRAGLESVVAESGGVGYGVRSQIRMLKYNCDMTSP